MTRSNNRCETLFLAICTIVIICLVGVIVVYATKPCGYETRHFDVFVWRHNSDECTQDLKANGTLDSAQASGFKVYNSMSSDPPKVHQR